MRHPRAGVRGRAARAGRRLRAGHPDETGAVAKERRPAGRIAHCRQRALRRQRRACVDAVRKGARAASRFARGAAGARRRQLPGRRSRARANSL
nr:hypothetical protein [Burkholderia ambifaria]